MSADNWTHCPKCRLEEELELKEFKRRVDEAYGKVSSADYNKLRSDYVKAVNAAEADDDYGTRTLREDYEFYGIANGVLHVDYSASCESCGWSYSLNTEYNVLEEEK